MDPPRFGSEGTPEDASEDILVDLLSVEDSEDPDLGPRDPVHDAVFPDPKLPVSLQAPLQGRVI